MRDENLRKKHGRERWVKAVQERRIAEGLESTRSATAEVPPPPVNESRRSGIPIGQVTILALMALVISSTSMVSSTFSTFKQWFWVKHELLLSCKGIDYDNQTERLSVDVILANNGNRAETIDSILPVMILGPHDCIRGMKPRIDDGAFPLENIENVPLARKVELEGRKSTTKICSGIVNRETMEKLMKFSIASKRINVGLIITYLGNDGKTLISINQSVGFVSKLPSDMVQTRKPDGMFVLYRPGVITACVGAKTEILPSILPTNWREENDDAFVVGFTDAKLIHDSMLRMVRDPLEGSLTPGLSTQMELYGLKRHY